VTFAIDAAGEGVGLRVAAPYNGTPKKMGDFLNREALKPSLVQMPATDAPMRHMPAQRVGVRRPPKEGRHFSFLAWPETAEPLHCFDGLFRFER